MAVEVRLTDTGSSTRTAAPGGIFACHAPGDGAFGQGVARYLRAQGLDVSELPVQAGGEGWLATWSRQMATAAQVVLFVSELSPVPWLRAELDALFRSLARRPGLRLVPVIRAGFTDAGLLAALAPFDPLLLSRDRAHLEAELASLAARLRLPPGAPVAPGVGGGGTEGSPWPGLRPFGLHEGRLFFGRGREVIDGAALLGAQPSGRFVRWLRVEGPAGVGKASFARAGMAPAVVRGAVAGAPLAWRVLALRPGEQPLDNLVAGLATVFTGMSGTALRAQVEAAGGLADLVREALSPDEGLLLVIDHLEDVAAAPAGTQLNRFDAALSEALADFDRRLLLLTTTRAERVVATLLALPRCAAVAGDTSAVLALGGLSVPGLDEAIAGPASLVGRAFAPEVAERLRDDAVRHASTPACLAWALHALDRGPPADLSRYLSLGGVDAALAKALDARLAALTDEERQRVRALVLALVRGGRGHADLMGMLSYEEALAAAGAGPKAEVLVATLAEGPHQGPVAPPLLMAVGEGAQHTVRLAHSALLTRWPTLVDWLREDRPVLERCADVEAAAQAYAEAGARAEDLPSGPRLAVYAGLDLVGEQPARLRRTLRTAARHYVEAAQAAEAARDKRAGAEAEAKAKAEQLGRDKVLRRTRNKLLGTRILALLLLGGGGVAGWLAYEAHTRQGELETQVQWASDRRQEAVDALRAAEERHLAAEKRRLTAERERRETERERKQSAAQGARAEASADLVLDFAIEAAVEADDYFSRIAHPDAKYARRMYAQAVLEKLRARLAETPGNQRLQFLLARQHTLLGNLAVDIGAYRAALPEFEAAVVALKQLIGVNPDTRYVEALAQAHTTLGRLLSNPRRGPVDAERAAQSHTEAVAIWAALATDLPEDRRLMEQLADTRADLGVAELQRSRVPEALEVLTASVEASRQLRAANPDDAEAIHALARRLGYLAEAQVAAGEVDGGLAQYEEAIAMLEPLAQGTAESRPVDRTRAQLKRLLREAKIKAGR